MKPPLSSKGLLGHGLPIKTLELLWLDCAAAYEVHNDNLMEDGEWDKLGVELNERWQELSPYLSHAVARCWPFPEPEEGENRLKTGSGIDWTRGPGLVSAEALRVDRGGRVSYWVARINSIRFTH